MPELPPSPPEPSVASSISNFLRLPMLAGGGLVVAATGMLYFKQNEIIYPRYVPSGSRTDVLTPSYFDIPDDQYERVRIQTPDNETLDSFLIRPLRKFAGVKPRFTVMMFHGNAGNIGHRVPIAEALAYNLACNVFMVEYRGYGASTGTPDEKGIKIDAQAALDYLLSREDLKDTKLVVYGQSLGGAVSTWLSVKNPDKVAAVVLENTFLSLRKMVPSILPAGKYIAWLCHQLWATENLIPNLKLPVLFLSGLKDEIVPPPHMTELYGLCPSEAKEFKSFPNGTHNETVSQPGYLEHVCRFLNENVD